MEEQPIATIAAVHNFLDRKTTNPIPLTSSQGADDDAGCGR